MFLLLHTVLMSHLELPKHLSQSIGSTGRKGGGGGLERENDNGPDPGGA